MNKTINHDEKETPSETKDILGLDLHFPEGKLRPNIYMVYSYVMGMGGARKRVRGVYPTQEKAMARQTYLIPEGSFRTNGSRCGKSREGGTLCAFVDVLPLGDTDIEMHTTPIRDWKYYI